MGFLDGECPTSSECEFAGICNEGDTSLIYDAVQSSPEIRVLGSELDQDQFSFLVKPVLEAWLSESCLRDKVRSLRELQFREDISHVSITIGSSVLERIDQLLGVS